MGGSKLKVFLFHPPPFLSWLKTFFSPIENVHGVRISSLSTRVVIRLGPTSHGQYDIVLSCEDSIYTTNGIHLYYHGILICTIQFELSGEVLHDVAKDVLHSVGPFPRMRTPAHPCDAQ